MRFKKFISRYKFEILISLVALSLSIFIGNRVWNLGLTRILVDANSHLNLSRQAIDSLTPGISQIGFWPPLLHLLLVPFVSINFLYHSGLAGVFVLVPSLIFGAIILYKLLLAFTENRFISFYSVLIFLLNPYILYYSVTPMMEILFLTNIIAVAYFMVRWLRTEKLKYLLLTAIFVSLATVSRFEGIMLVPTTLSLVLIRLILKKKSYAEIESLLIMFGIPTILGILSILLYGYVFASNPLAFLNSQWSSQNIAGDLFRPTQHNIFLTARYYLHASYHMISKILVIAFLTGLLAFIGTRKKLEVLMVSAILLTPFAFDFLATLKGNAVLYIPELPPYNVYLNVRYGLYSILFFIVLFSLLLATLFKLELSSNSFIKFFKQAVIYAVMALIFVYSVIFLYRVSYLESYESIRAEAKDYPYKDQVDVAQQLKSSYDFGEILMTRGLHDFVAVESQIGLKNFILEANYKYYDQALERPWLFARWVVTYNPNCINYGLCGHSEDDWSYQIEKIATKWIGSDYFNKYYELVYENKRERLYKVRDREVTKYALQRGYDPDRIPSLNTSITTWNPDTVYDYIKFTGGADYKRLVELELQDYYLNNLRPLYEKGYFIEKDYGTSETQAYAMLQSLWSNDKEIFDKVWNWTRENLQSKDDLFSWKYEIKSDSKVKIIDQNSATDADTDIAYALLMASDKWGSEQYQKEARKIISNIWEKETVEVLSKRYVTAGNWAAKTNCVVINPSYFTPYAYRVFSKVDDKHNWKELVVDNYQLIDSISEIKLNGKPNYYLPVNWICLDGSNGVLKGYKDKEGGLDYSHDAFRLFWRISLDYRINGSKEAKEYLNKVVVFEQQISKQGKVCTEITANGECTSTVSNMAGPLSVFLVKDKNLSEFLLNNYYLPDKHLIETDGLSFYEKSWYYFGLLNWLNYYE